MNKTETEFKPVFRKSPPEGVVEVTGAVGRQWSLVERKDGSLMAVKTDGRKYGR